METRSACIGVSELKALLDTLNESKCNISINICVIQPEPEEEPIPEPEIPPEIPKGILQVPGEEGIYYGHKHGALQISLDGNTVTTTWKRVKELASQSDEMIEKEAKRKYSDETSRSMFLRFVQAYREGRVKPLRAQHVEPEVIPVSKPVEEKPDMSLNTGHIDWSTVPAITFDGFHYQEHNGRIRLRSNSNGNICCTTWDKIIQLSQMPNIKLEIEVMTLYPERGHRNLICSLIDAYRNDDIKDPDAFARPLVNIDTSTNYDGNKIMVEGY